MPGCVCLLQPGLRGATSDTMNLYAILKGGTIMKQLLFASDLDGTLLNAAHETDEEILTGMQERADEWEEF